MYCTHFCKVSRFGAMLKVHLSTATGTCCYEYRQDRQCTQDVTLRRGGAPIRAMEKQ